MKNKWRTFELWFSNAIGLDCSNRLSSNGLGFDCEMTISIEDTLTTLVDQHVM